MKYIIILSLLVLKNDSIYSQISVDSILRRAYKNLNSLNTLQYHNTRELNYSSENYHHISKWDVYHDFQNPDAKIGFRYQIEDSTSKQVFNGTEKFDLDKKMKTIKVETDPDARSLNEPSAFYNSMITLRNVLPLIIEDQSATKAIADTTINNTNYTSITVNIGKR